MADTFPPCPKCSSEYTYEMGDLLVCPECAHEWSPSEDAEAEAAAQVKDAVGNVLVEGDTVTIVKDVKVKGAGGGTVKVGTRAKGIRIINGVGDHDLEGKVDGFGVLQLKSSIVKKV